MNETTSACKICTKVFTLVGNLNKHVRIRHASRKRFVDDATFPYEGELGDHEVAVHAGGSGFTCHVYKKIFA